MFARRLLSSHRAPLPISLENSSKSSYSRTYVIPGGLVMPEATRGETVGQPRRERREESFMPVEITGAWVRAEKGIVGRVVLGWFAVGSFDSQDEPFDSQGELEAPAS